MARSRRSPTPGQAVRGASSGKPAMALLDLLGRRWALRLIWELGAGPLTSRALREVCGVSPTVLNDRSRELRGGGLLELDASGGYALSPLGRELYQQLLPLGHWAERWAKAARGAR